MAKVDEHIQKLSSWNEMYRKVVSDKPLANANCRLETEEGNLNMSISEKGFLDVSIFNGTNEVSMSVMKDDVKLLMKFLSEWYGDKYAVEDRHVDRQVDKQVDRQVASVDKSVEKKSE